MSMSLEKPLVSPRPQADAELAELLLEIAGWDDHMLTHMHGRFSTSRLFRVHHEPDGPLTPHAERLLAETRAEMARRGLEPLTTS